MCEFPAETPLWREEHWHGCGRPIAEHRQERFGERWVVFYPPVSECACCVHAPISHHFPRGSEAAHPSFDNTLSYYDPNARPHPCFVRDVGLPPPLSREEARERAREGRKQAFSATSRAVAPGGPV